jgi:hypothetical protein
MKILVNRPRSLLLVAALAVTVAMCPLPAANAASSADATPVKPAASSTQCNFVRTLDACESTDPTVAYYDSPTGNVLDCTFAFGVTWGDGGSTTKTLTNPPAGHNLVGEHTYVEPGVYSIAVMVEVTAGPCTAMNSAHTFTLLAAPLPTQPSPTFVCVTGPGGSCLQPGAGVPTPNTWAPTPPGWLTSSVTGGCVLEFTGIGETVDFLEDLGNAVQYDESNGNFLVLLKGGLVDSCTELAYYVLAHKPLPQNPDHSSGAALRQNRGLRGSVNSAIAASSTQSLFQTIPKSQLNSLKKLPFLRQRLGYAVAELGSEAALSQKYRITWGGGTQKSVVCQVQRSGYRCYWHFQYKGARYTGYVLIGVTGNHYRLERVV